MARQRPVDVFLFSLIGAFGAVLQIITGVLAFLLFSDRIDVFGLTWQRFGFDPFMHYRYLFDSLLTAPILIIMGVLLLLAYYGIFNLRKNGWKIALPAEVLFFILAIYNEATLNTFISITMIIYLLTRRKLFK